MNEPFDPAKLAVALTYERDVDPAPKVTASGKGYMAEQIVRLAREHGIEIREDKDLVAILATLDLDTPIPVEAYVAVAEILSYIYRANDQAKRKRSQ